MGTQTLQGQVSLEANPQFDGVWGWGDDFMTFSDIVTIVMHGQDRGSQQLLVTERMEGPTEPTWQEGNHHQV